MIMWNAAAGLICCITDCCNEGFFGGGLPEVNLLQGGSANEHVNMGIYQTLQGEHGHLFRPFVRSYVKTLREHGHLSDAARHDISM